MALVIGVVGGDFVPEILGMVHVIDVGEFVKNDVVAEGFGKVHEADVERDCAAAAAAAPASVGMGEAKRSVFVAVFFGPEIETIWEVFFGFFG